MSKGPVALSIAPEPTEGDERYYDTIHATVMESARGRWLLAEYARRNRNADTEFVLSAIDRMASLIQAGRDQQAHPAIPDESSDLPETISGSVPAQPQSGPPAEESQRWAQELAIPADAPTPVEAGVPSALDRPPTNEPEAFVGLERVESVAVARMSETRFVTADIASLIRATAEPLSPDPVASILNDAKLDIPDRPLDAAPAEHEETDSLLDLEQELFAPSPANPPRDMTPAQAPCGAEPTSEVARMALRQSKRARRARVSRRRFQGYRLRCSQPRDPQHRFGPLQSRCRVPSLTIRSQPSKR